MERLGKILIVDDNQDVLLALNILLEPLAEKVKVVLSPDRVEHFLVEFKPDLILLDMNFTRDTVSGEEGLDLLRMIRRRDPKTIVVMMTAYADTDKAVQSIKAGATDFVSKPWQNEKLIATLQAAYQLKQKQDATAKSADEVTLIGESEGMLRIKETILRLRTTDANVLLLGENGTGKDVVARCICQNSQRAGCPFVSIDMGTVPDQLFESELFGYVKGAFTDARRDKPGRMEMANGGTLFLDEVGNLSAKAQSKLLTAIEKNIITRVGSNTPTNIDVRYICATNADLRRQMEDGTFRQDLFYRINTVEIHLPPLRTRGNDIQLLADHFLSLFTKHYGRGRMTISRAGRNKLQDYAWPGNVRELQHTVERAVVMATGRELQADDFFIHEPNTIVTELPNEVFRLNDLERNAIQLAMERSRGNISKAAEMLGITRYALYRKIEKLGL